MAESTSGTLIGIERTASQGELPETIGTEASLLLLQEIKRGDLIQKRMFRFVLMSLGGVVDSSHQTLILQLMVLCPEDISKVLNNFQFVFI